MSRPLIAMTMGDPAGIGPEIVVAAASSPVIRSRCQLLLLGDPVVYARAAALLPKPPALRVIAQAQEGLEAANGQAIPILATDGSGCYPQRAVTLASARAMLAPLDIACDLALAGRIDGIISGPLNKEAFSLLGLGHRDELDYMAARTGAVDAWILGIMRGVWVTSVAEHVPFREIADRITRENVFGRILALAEAMQRDAAGHNQGKPAPIAVAALNAHGGEGGALGTEEITEIGPAVAEARARGLPVTGPVPADTVFARALAGEFTGVVAMYHDQANIARKLQPMPERLTLFEGLPVAAATTAHGVAYDIAWQGHADPGSLLAALDMVIRMAKGRARPS